MIFGSNGMGEVLARKIRKLASFLAFPGYDLPGLAVLGPAALAIAVRGRRCRSGLWLGLVFGLAFFVPLLSWTGIYVASIVFIAFFMRWLGKYAWWKVATVSIGTMVVFFLIFEVWFKVPLPKGPLENLLGIA